MHLPFYPRTLEDAVDYLVEQADEGEIEHVKTHGTEHHGFGMALRNAWALWESTPLTEHLKKRFKLFGHGDDMSGLILHCFERKVRGLPWGVDEVAARYKKHWRKEGLDPKTGKKLKK